MSEYIILFVEDDSTIAFGVENALQLSGYTVHHYSTAEEAIQQNPKWDIAIIDWMLPGMSGLELLQQMKSKYPVRPIILLTAKNSPQDLVQGLDNGADDYVSKPFQLSELLARVRARLRESDTEENSHIYFVDELQIDLRRQVIRKGTKETHLTTHENAVLQYLIERKGQEISRQELLEQVWGYSPTMQTRTVDNQILKLRKKMEINPARPRHIITVHGVGYRFVG
jgi:DNA-binding response OmpR family regulator